MSNKSDNVRIPSVIGRRHFRMTSAVPKQEIVETLGAFLFYKGVAGRSRGEYVQALGFFGQTNLDFVDCLLAARAKDRKVEPFAFDKELLRAIR